MFPLKEFFFHPAGKLQKRLSETARMMEAQGYLTWRDPTLSHSGNTITILQVLPLLPSFSTSPFAPDHGEDSRDQSVNLLFFSSLLFSFLFFSFFFSLFSFFLKKKLILFSQVTISFIRTFSDTLCKSVVRNTEVYHYARYIFYRISTNSHPTACASLAAWT